MKINRILAFLGFSLVLVFLSTGCATAKRPTVDTWRDPQFSPSRADKIALTTRPIAAARTRN